MEPFPLRQRVAVPIGPPAFALYRMTREFYQEANDRQAFNDDCVQYQVIAQAHQRELSDMGGDIN
jgi:hypothetical protein